MKTYKSTEFTPPVLAIQGDLNDAIAIIGMGCVFPDANNPAQYWNNIINCHCAIEEIPKERWDPGLYYSPGRDKSFMSYSKICASVKDFKKDPLKFHIPPVSAFFIERIQFLMLEAAYQALEDGGYLKNIFLRIGQLFMWGQTVKARWSLHIMYKLIGNDLWIHWKP